MSNTKLKAVVVGGTGAVGREVVGQLLVSPRWGSVVAVGRRAADPPAAYKGQEGYDEGKLKQAVVNMDNLEAEAQQAFAGADSVFCCLGTTRAAAGTADQFRKVDLEYVAATARAAKAAAVPTFALVSSQGARPSVWATDLKLLHGLLYMKTKGQAEEAVKSMGLSYTAIMRPGMLDRGELARGVERAFSKLMSSVAVSQVAHVMIADVERWLDARAAAGAAAHAGAQPEVKVFEMGDIQKFS
ncbi:hypothetical protein CHLNCDRAFT_145410 [Chlorella variabilis]|uniref:NAD(P)-binding domain-containing protein n=1 Tax=Chlorella variabilis TaxID=554065 RepID=E1ZED1_CHLVA|nr:hypothetical protein CHLNCDRAFT_145410 [Chlorella variabilis]EFN55849.1 hypothetical protein CHLNCDRAFT_145410 [Chlorella variabilis]|eukprot:XP_005847951.1 hypothetical protein CHLNCDRAFT_145410 [Chlorella variabilis]